MCANHCNFSLPVKTSPSTNRRTRLGAVTIKLNIILQFCKYLIFSYCPGSLILYSYFVTDQTEETEARMSTGDPTYHQVAEAAPQEGAAVAAEGQEQQAQPAPSVFETLKSMAVRIMIFYFIMNFFKKSPQQPSAGTADGVSRTKGPATNLFSEGMGFDLYLYISEQEEFGEFNVSKPLT